MEMVKSDLPAALEPPTLSPPLNPSTPSVGPSVPTLSDLAFIFHMLHQRVPKMSQLTKAHLQRSGANNPADTRIPTWEDGPQAERASSRGDASDHAVQQKADLLAVGRRQQKDAGPWRREGTPGGQGSRGLLLRLADAHRRAPDLPPTTQTSETRLRRDHLSLFRLEFR